MNVVGVTSRLLFNNLMDGDEFFSASAEVVNFSIQEA